MVKEIRVYYEGPAALKPGFCRFFKTLIERAADRRCRFYIASKSGAEACRDFTIALREHSSAWNVLLIDSEGPIASRASALLCQRHGWSDAHIDSIFWMEAWFHADKDKVAEFYGRDFRRTAMKANPNVEEIPLKDLEAGLSAATKNTSKSDYFENKATHGTKLLELIRPERVRDASHHCHRLFDTVLAKLSQ